MIHTDSNLLPINHKCISTWMLSISLHCHLFIPNTIPPLNLKEQYESQHLRSGTRLITILVTAFRRTAVTFSDRSPMFSPHPLTETDPSPPTSSGPIMSLPQSPYIFLYTLQVMWFNTKIRTYCFISSNSILLDFCKTLEPTLLVLMASSYTTLSLLQHNSFSWSNFLLTDVMVTCSNHEALGGAEKETAGHSES